MGCVRRPEGDALGVDFGLQDGDERGLVFADGDGFGEVVVEVVVEGGGGGVGGEGGCGSDLVLDEGAGAVAAAAIAAHDSALCQYATSS